MLLVSRLRATNCKFLLKAKHVTTLAAHALLHDDENYAKKSSCGKALVSIKQSMPDSLNWLVAPVSWVFVCCDPKPMKLENLTQYWKFLC